MSKDSDQRAAELAHLKGTGFSKGDPVTPPIVLASMFHLPGDPEGFRQYGRFDNPTWEATEALISHMENARALAFPSGMAAISAVFFSNLRSGDRVLLPADGYYTTRLLADRYLVPFGIHYDTRPVTRFSDDGFDGYRMVFIETPSNPGLDVCDLEAISGLARKSDAIIVVDNTTMTPYGQRPLDLGADIVVAADTKAPNGHSDALFGHMASRDEKFIQAAAEWRKLTGSIPGPFESWLVYRGMLTLEVRFSRMCDTAELVADRLAGHKAVHGVRYPGLKSDPANGLATRQMDRYGFLIGLKLKDRPSAEAFIEKCRLIQPATSFGGVHTSAERRARWGDAVAEGFVRLSIGCEPAEPLWEALAEALDQI